MAVDEIEDGDDQPIEFAEPTSLMIPAGEGAIAVPCLDSLAEALGAVPLAFQTDGNGGFYWLTPELKWLPVERKGSATVKRVQ